MYSFVRNAIIGVGKVAIFAAISPLFALVVFFACRNWKEFKKEFKEALEDLFD